ncbi:MAG: hypothetical protein M1358_22550, partial [Chloroflexi bacterium]|nr:hypothetical protein [Chloroflexota bacterium]
MSRLPFHRLMKIVIPALIVFLAVLSIPVYRQVTGEALPFSLQARTPSLTPLRSLFELNDLGTVQPEQTQVLSLTPSQDGRIYIGTAYLGQLSFYSGSFTSAGQATPGGTRIYSLATGKDGNIYGGMDNNAYFFAYYPSDGSFNPLGQAVSEEQEVKAVVSGLDGLIYGGTAPNGHFFVYDPSQGGRPVDLGQPLAGEASISALSVDSNGLIWGGSSPSGFVFFFNPNSRSFSQVGQTSSAVTAIAAKAGSIFIGTSTGRLFSFSQANGLSDLGQATADNGRIETLTGGSDGRIYGGTYPDGRVFAYDPVSSAFIDLGSPV